MLRRASSITSYKVIFYEALLIASLPKVACHPNSPVCHSSDAECHRKEICAVLTEIEGILNSKPLGYVSSDIPDPDLVTLNLLFMGRQDPSLPQIVFIRSQSYLAVGVADIPKSWLTFSGGNLLIITFQLYTKWQKETVPLQPGVVAMIMDQQSPRALWRNPVLREAIKKKRIRTKHKERTLVNEPILKIFGSYLNVQFPL